MKTMLGFSHTFFYEFIGGDVSEFNQELVGLVSILILREIIFYDIVTILLDS